MIDIMSCSTVVMIDILACSTVVMIDIMSCRRGVSHTNLIEECEDLVHWKV